MGTRQITIRFCDRCKKEIQRNVVSDRLIVEKGDFKAEVEVCRKDAFVGREEEPKMVSNDRGDLCLSCLLEMLNSKPKRKYVRKQSAEQLATSIIDRVMPELNIENPQATSALNTPEQAVTEKVRKKARKVTEKPSVMPEPGDKETEHLTIRVPWAEGVEYLVKIGESEATGPTLRLTVLAALEEFNLPSGELPGFLTDYEKKLITNILNA